MLGIRRKNKVEFRGGADWIIPLILTCFLVLISAGIYRHFPILSTLAKPNSTASISWRYSLPLALLGLLLLLAISAWLYTSYAKSRKRPVLFDQQSALLKSILEIDRRIIKAEPLNDIFETLCDGVVDLGYALCWIGLPKDDGSVAPVAWRGFEEDYLKSIKVRWDDAPKGLGPTGRAIRLKKPQTVRNTKKNRNYRVWKEEAGKRNYLNSASIPMIANDDVVGAINVYSTRTAAFGADELNLLTTFAQHACLVLMNAYMHEEVRQSEERLRYIFDNASEGFFLVQVEEDGGFRYILANPVIERRIGTSVVGKRPHEILPQAIVEHSLSRYRRAVATGKSMFYENDYVIDGKRRYFRLFMDPIKDESGRVDKIAGVVTELTTLRSLEKQLAQAQRLEAVGALAGGIAHDFNNVLSIILSCGEMLKPAVAHDPEAMDDVSEIIGAAKRASKITRQLLAFSRRQILDPVPMDLNQALNDVLGLIRKVIGDNIDLEIHLAKNAYPVVADIAQMEQVLMNLCVNAMDAMPSGGTLGVKTENVTLDKERAKEISYASPGHFVKLTVSDTGVGMSADVREHIFEPFYTTKERGKGAGLGLPMVYGIVKQHKGFINVDTSLVEGTTFNVYVPATPSIKIPERKTDKKPIKLGHETILVANDDPVILKIIEKTLSTYGYKSFTAADGLEAMKVFDRHSDAIQMALLDVVMPRKSGPAAYREMLQKRPDLKVLFISGYPFESFDDPPLIEKGQAFLPLPFTPDELNHRLRELLDAG